MFGSLSISPSSPSFSPLFLSTFKLLQKAPTKFASQTLFAIQSSPIIDKNKFKNLKFMLFKHACTASANIISFGNK